MQQARRPLRAKAGRGALPSRILPPPGAEPRPFPRTKPSAHRSGACGRPREAWAGGRQEPTRDRGRRERHCPARRGRQPVGARGVKRPQRNVTTKGANTSHDGAQACGANVGRMTQRATRGRAPPPRGVRVGGGGSLNPVAPLGPSPQCLPCSPHQGSLVPITPRDTRERSKARKATARRKS